MRTMADLYSSVARVLSGARVQLKFKHPSIEDHLACVSRNESGEIVIEIAPDLPGELSVKVFLHELAHVRLGHAQKFVRSNISEYASRSLKNAFKQDPDQEKQADLLSANWLAYGERWKGNFQLHGESDEEAMLQALRYYYGKK